MVLLTGSNDETLPLLLYSLSRHSLLDDFNNIVAGVASVQEVAAAVSPDLELKTLQHFSDYCVEVRTKYTFISSDFLPKRLIS